MFRSLMAGVVFCLVSGLLLGASGDKKMPIYFFTGTNCPHCIKVEPLVEQLSQEQDLDIQFINISNPRKNYQMFMEFCKLYHVPVTRGGVPAIFIGNDYLIGDSRILQSLRSTIEQYRQSRSSTKGTLTDNARSIAERYSK